MTTSIHEISHQSVLAFDRNGNPFMSNRTRVEFWTNADSSIQQGKEVAKIIRKLNLPDRQVAPLHVEQAYGLKGDKCGWKIAVTVA